MVSEEKLFSCFPGISLCKTSEPRDVPIFWLQGQNLNKLGRDLLGNATYQISRRDLDLEDSDKKTYSCFHYIILRKICDPRVDQFKPQGHKLNKIGKVYQVMPHTKYQCCRLCDFREDVFIFFHI